VEEQALVSTTIFGYPRRLAMGFDQNRLLMLSAVIEKRGGLRLKDQDVHVNIAQGLTVKETASDLGIAAAIVSSITEKPVPANTTFIGELGLSGEVRAVRFVERRLKEMKKFGIERAVIPRSNVEDARRAGIEAVGVSNIREAIDNFF
jgi:DNA repair protein RadA/Sms